MVFLGLCVFTAVHMESHLGMKNRYVAAFEFLFEPPYQFNLAEV